MVLAPLVKQICTDGFYTRLWKQCRYLYWRAQEFYSPGKEQRVVSAAIKSSSSNCFFFYSVAQLQARKFGLAYYLDENNLNGDL